MYDHDWPGSRSPLSKRMCPMSRTRARLLPLLVQVMLVPGSTVMLDGVKPPLIDTEAVPEGVQPGCGVPVVPGVVVPVVPGVVVPVEPGVVVLVVPAVVVEPGVVVPVAPAVVVEPGVVVPVEPGVLVPVSLAAGLLTLMMPSYAPSLLLNENVPLCPKTYKKISPALRGALLNATGLVTRIACVLLLWFIQATVLPG